MKASSAGSARVQVVPSSPIHKCWGDQAGLKRRIQVRYSLTVPRPAPESISTPHAASILMQTAAFAVDEAEGF
jgi:hypothetical protein